MLYTYNQCITQYGSDYQLKKALRDGKIYKIEKGIYSDCKYVSEMEILQLKYPSAIFTMESAFYYYSLTDVIPDEYVLATDRDAAKIGDKKMRIRQCFYASKILDIGKVKMEYQGTEIMIYDMERMLVELVRNRNNLPFDYYKEIIAAYRKRVELLDVEKIQDYAVFFPASERIMDAIQLEVF